MRRCGVLGSPIAHSLSPTLHRAAYAALGLDWTYDAFDVDASKLAGWVARLGPEWRGLSLTMPLKEAAVDVCTDLRRPADLVRAVNTVVFEPDGDMVGHNTDVPGFAAAWRRAGVERPDHAVVVGGGATARSAVAALATLGVRAVSVLVRSPDRSTELLALLARLHVDSRVVVLGAAVPTNRADLLVSTIPAVTDVSFVPFVAELVANAEAVCDVVYSPRRTPFVQAAERAGVPCVEGFDLLLAQAALQVELMTGAERVPVEAMRAAGLAELDRREPDREG